MLMNVDLRSDTMNHSVGNMSTWADTFFFCMLPDACSQGSIKFQLEFNCRFRARHGAV